MGVELAIAGGLMMAGGAAGASKTKMSAPPKRSYYGEMSEALNAQAGIFPSLLKQEAKFVPQFQELQKNTLLGQIKTMEELYSRALPIGAKIGQQALNQQVPVMSSLTRSSLGLYDRAMGTDAYEIYNQVMQRGNEQMAAGRGLTAEEQSMATQAARGAYMARGMSTGNQAVAGEVLANYNLANQREMQRLNYANVAYGLSKDRASSALQMYGVPLGNAAAVANPQNLIGTAGQMVQGLGPTLFNPEAQYNADINTANVQNQMSADMAKYQGKQAMWGGLMNIGGSLLGKGIGLMGKGPSSDKDGDND